HLIGGRLVDLARYFEAMIGLELRHGLQHRVGIFLIVFRRRGLGWKITLSNEPLSQPDDLRSRTASRQPAARHLGPAPPRHDDLVMPDSGRHRPIACGRHHRENAFASKYLGLGDGLSALASGKISYGTEAETATCRRTGPAEPPG